MSEQLDQVWREIQRIETCMLITADGGPIRGRPMVGHPDPAANRIWFVARRRRGEGGTDAQDPRVCLAYIDITRTRFISICGTATPSDDREKLRELWIPAFDAWYPNGPDDPDAILLAVRPERAEVWDSPNSDLIVALKMLTATPPPRTSSDKTASA